MSRSYPPVPSRFRTKTPGRSAANSILHGTAKTTTTAVPAELLHVGQSPTASSFSSDSLELHQHSLTPDSQMLIYAGSGRPLATRTTTVKQHNGQTAATAKEIKRGRSNSFVVNASTRKVSPRPTFTRIPSTDDLDVLAYIYDVRRATTQQVARRFNKADRTIRRRLATLNMCRLIVSHQVADRRVVHHLSRRGLNELEEKRGGERSRLHDWFKTSGNSPESLTHMLGVTEIVTMFLRTAAARGDRVISVERRHYHPSRQLRYEYMGHHHRLEPDASLLYRLADGRLRLFMIEFQCYDKRGKILAKYEAYQDWYQGGGSDYIRGLFADNDSSQFPDYRILWVAGDVHDLKKSSRRLVNLYTLALVQPRGLRGRMFFASSSELTTIVADPRPLGVQAWYRTKDARAWLREFHSLVTKGSGNINFQHRQFVAKRLVTLPRQPVIA